MHIRSHFFEMKVVYDTIIRDSIKQIWLCMLSSHEYSVSWLKKSIRNQMCTSDWTKNMHRNGQGGFPTVQTTFQVEQTFLLNYNVTDTFVIYCPIYQVTKTKLYLFLFQKKGPIFGTGIWNSNYWAFPSIISFHFRIVKKRFHLLEKYMQICNKFKSD